MNTKQEKKTVINCMFLSPFYKIIKFNLFVFLWHFYACLCAKFAIRKSLFGKEFTFRKSEQNTREQHRKLGLPYSVEGLKVMTLMVEKGSHGLILHKSSTKNYHCQFSEKVNIFTLNIPDQHIIGMAINTVGCFVKSTGFVETVIVYAQ